jgi:6-phosphogluconate dehydrogenase
MAELGLFKLEMGVLGAEDGARHGPSLMPGVSFVAYKYIEDVLPRSRPSSLMRS